MRYWVGIMLGCILLGVLNMWSGRSFYQAVPLPAERVVAGADPLEAQAALFLFLSCLDTLSTTPLAPVQPMLPLPSGIPAALEVYNRACGIRLQDPQFSEYRVRYGVAAVDAINALVGAQTAPAAAFLLTDPGVEPGPVWMAAFGRAAAEVRSFHAELHRHVDPETPVELLPAVDLAP